MKFNFLRKVFAKVHIKSPMIGDGMRLDLSLQLLSFVGLLGDDQIKTNPLITYSVSRLYLHNTAFILLRLLLVVAQCITWTILTDIEYTYNTCQHKLKFLLILNRFHVNGNQRLYPFINYVHLFNDADKRGRIQLFTEFSLIQTCTNIAFQFYK